jgi:hypothetical protein
MSILILGNSFPKASTFCHSYLNNEFNRLKLKCLNFMSIKINSTNNGSQQRSKQRSRIL